MRICAGCSEKYGDKESVCPLCWKPYNKADTPLATDDCGRAKTQKTAYSSEKEGCGEKTESCLCYAGCVSGKEEGYAVTGCRRAVPPNLVIPDSYMGKPVLRIDTGAFRGQETLTTVTLPNPLREIGDSAFEKCTNLKAVCGGKSLMYIGDGAFMRCAYLERFDALLNQQVGYSVSAFAGCYHLHF